MSLLRADIGLKQGVFSLEARLEAPSDGITVLFGPSGSGKSTLLAVLAGLSHADRQTIALGDRDLSSLPPHQRGIGLVFQDARLFPHLSVRRNIEYAARRAPGAAPAVTTRPSFSATRWEPSAAASSILCVTTSIGRRQERCM